MRRILLCLFLLLPSLALAGGNTPEEAFNQYSDAVVANDWVRASSFFSAEDIKRTRVFFEKAWSRPGGAQLRKQSLGELDDAQVAKLTDVELVGKSLGGLMAVLGTKAGGMKITGNHIIGTVREGDATAYVVYRQSGKVGQFDVGGTDVITIRLRDGTWRVALPEEFETLMKMMDSMAEPAAK